MQSLKLSQGSFRSRQTGCSCRDADETDSVLPGKPDQRPQGGNTKWRIMVDATTGLVAADGGGGVVAPPLMVMKMVIIILK